MGGEWRTETLRDIGVSLIDCEHRTPPAAESGYPYIAIPQLRDGRIDLSNVRRITRDHYVEWTKKAKPQKDDVILSRRCNPGETAAVPPELECALGQNLVLLRTDGTRVYPPFLRWLTRGPQWWEQVRMFINVGAVFDSLKCVDIPSFRLRIPPFPEQQNIASILGALDDKIELNRQMNQTLEGIAQALFKSWFVDFDPVRAKMEGRDPGLPHEVADLFPDSLVSGTLKPLPEGWRYTRLGDVIGINENNVSKQYPHEAIEYISISSVESGRLLSTQSVALSKAPSRAKRLVRHGDVVWSMVRPNRRSYLWMYEPAENTVVSTGFAVLTPQHIPSPYLYHLVTQDEFVGYLAANADGSAYPAVRPDVFARAVVTLPSTAILDAFQAAVGPMMRRIGLNQQESETLAGIRDTLLPKLLSGELPVKDFEKRTEALL
jgi:type I restriction enzyme S subunit